MIILSPAGLSLTAASLHIPATPPAHATSGAAHSCQAAHLQALGLHPHLATHLPAPVLTGDATCGLVPGELLVAVPLPNSPAHKLYPSSAYDKCVCQMRDVGRSQELMVRFG